MKVKVKGLVFAGLAAVIFAGNAMAAVDTTPQPGDLDNTTNLNYVTSKKYVDRVVTNAKADTTALAGRVSEAEAAIDVLEDNAEMKSNKVANLAEVIDASDLAHKYPNVGAVKNALEDKQDKSDSDVTTAGNYIQTGTGVAANLGRLDSQVKINADAIGTINSNIGTVPEGSTVMAEITAAQEAATYDDTALEARVTTAEGNITGLQNAKENLSNKVTSGLVSVDASGKITSVSAGNAANYASTGAISSDLTKVKGAIELKQDALTTAQQDAVNSGITSTKVGNYDDHIADGTIHVTATQKTNWQNATDAVNNATTGLDTKLPTATYNSQVGTVNASNMGTTAGTVVTAIKELSDNKQDEITSSNKLPVSLVDGALTSADMSAYDAHIADGDIHVTAAQKTEWSGKQDALTSAQQSAVDSGITAAKVSTYDAYATNKQEKTDSAVSAAAAGSAATGGLLTAGQGVGANLVSVATQATTNKTDIATINSSAVMTSGIDSTKVAQIATNASNITNLQTESATHQLISNKATDVTTVAAADKDTKYPTVGAVQAPSSCNSNAPCAWINNAWVPIQQ